MMEDRNWAKALTYALPVLDQKGFSSWFIMPAILEELPSRPETLILASYSLTGLFAMYAAYRTDVITHIVSASGSLWYPGTYRLREISQYVKTCALCLFFIGRQREPYSQ